MRKKIVKHQLVAFVFISLVAGCGSDGDPASSLQSQAVLNGNWKLVSVQCDGAESGILGSQGLLDENPVASHISFTGTEAQRVWKIPGCTVTTPITLVNYPGSNIVRLT